MKTFGFADGLALLAITAWVGALWGVGYVAVPVLFQAQPDKILAGMLAGKMFALVAYVGMVSASYLLLYQLKRSNKTAFKQALFWIVAVMLLLALVVQFGIQPVMAELKTLALPGDVMHSEYAGRFRTLHGVSSILYLLQSLLGAALVLKFRRS